MVETRGKNRRESKYSKYKRVIGSRVLYYCESALELGSASASGRVKATTVG